MEEVNGLCLGTDQIFQRTIKLEGKKLYVEEKYLLTYFCSSSDSVSIVLLFQLEQ